MMAAHGIPVSAQEMINRLRERPLYRWDCTQCSAARNASAAASSCRHRVTRYLPNIASAASTAASILYIKKLLLLLPLHAAAARCMLPLQQQQQAAAASSNGSGSMQRQHAAAPCSGTIQRHHSAAPCNGTMQQHRAVSDSCRHAYLSDSSRSCSTDQNVSPTVDPGILN